MKDESDRLAGGVFRTRAFRILAGFVIAGLLYSLVIFFISPGRYRSTIVIEFLPDPFFQEPRGDQFVTTEGAVLTAPETLELVALSDVGGSLDPLLEFRVKTLEHIVEGSVVDGTNRFSIEVTHANPKHAQQIARELPIAYARRKETIRKGIIEKRILDLESEMENQADLLVLLPEKLRELLEAVGLTSRDEKLLTRELYLEFFQALPQEAQALKTSEWIEFEATWGEYEDAQAALTALKNQHGRAKEASAQKL